MVEGIDWSKLPDAGEGYQPEPLPRPEPVPEHVWLGDLSGWSIAGVDSDGRAFIRHRCGYMPVFAPHDNFLGNIVEWIAQHREHTCANFYRRMDWNRWRHYSGSEKEQR